MNDTNTEKRIGQAWKAHHRGDQRSAIDQFMALTERLPENIDAFWGLGLSYRRAGDIEKALEAFDRAQKLVQAELDKDPSEYGRLYMLNRMISQQIKYNSEFMK